MNWLNTWPLAAERFGTDARTLLATAFARLADGTDINVNN